MSSKEFCAIIWMLLISFDVVNSTIKLGTVSQKSHPMLASLFNAANNVRQLGTKGIGDDVRRPGIIGVTSDIMCSLCQKQGDVACIAIHCWNNENKTSVPSLDNLSPQLVPNSISVLQDNFDFNSQLDRHDRLQAHQLGNGIPTIHPQSGNGFPTIHKQPGNGFRRENNVDMRTLHTQLPLASLSEIPHGSNTAPIWSMTDSFQESAALPEIPRGNEAPILSMADSLKGRSTTLSEKHRPMDIMRDRIGETRTPITDNTNNDFVRSAIDQRNEFSNTNLHHDKLVPDTRNRPTGTLTNQPLVLSTDTIRQLIRNDSTSVSQTFNIATNRKIPIIKNVNNGNNLRFSDGVIGGHADVQPTNVNSGTNRMPEIPAANDVFADVKNVHNTVNRHTLVVEGQGNAKRVGILVGNAPAASNDISLFETSGQIVIQDSTNAQPETNPALTHSSAEHSHHGVNTAKNTGGSVNRLNKIMSPIHVQEHPVRSEGTDIIHPLVNEASIIQQQLPTLINNNIQIVSNNIVPQDMHIMNQASGNGLVGHDEMLSTTTSIPTMNPRRRAALKNWSKELLNGVNV